MLGQRQWCQDALQIHTALVIFHKSRSKNKILAMPKYVFCILTEYIFFSGTVSRSMPGSLISMQGSGGGMAGGGAGYGAGAVAGAIGGYSMTHRNSGYAHSIPASSVSAITNNSFGGSSARPTSATNVSGRTNWAAKLVMYIDISA